MGVKSGGKQGKGDFFTRQKGKTVVGDSVLPGDGLCTVVDCA